MTDAVDPAQPIELSADELLLLRLTCELAADEESPLGPIDVDVDPDRLETGARSLVKRKLADRRTYRPHRELVRRLLVVSEPDSRIVLLHTGPAQAERILDLYVRAGAHVAYRRTGGSYSFGPPLEDVDVRDEIRSNFKPRRSTGDFVELTMTAAEYFAFGAFAREVALKGQASLDAAPERSAVDATMEGTILMPGRRARFAPGDDVAMPRLTVPDEKTWDAALEALAAKGVLSKSDDGWSLRSPLFDLARGLATKHRYVLTRFDFGPSDWFVRDATLVPVPGSIFWLRTTTDGGLSITELDEPGLMTAVRSAIDSLEGVDTVDV